MGQRSPFPVTFLASNAPNVDKVVNEVVRLCLAGILSVDLLNAQQ